MNEYLNPLLSDLAWLYGVQTDYHDAFGQRRQASPEALLAVLRSLGAPLAGMADVPSALRERRQELGQRAIEPVSIAWAGEPHACELRLPEANMPMKITGSLILENGERQEYRWQPADLAVISSTEIEGSRFTIRGIPLPPMLPPGYHRLVVEMPGKTVESLVISAPVKAYMPEGLEDACGWGVFLPLYAVHQARGWGSGDYASLQDLMDWTGDQGGRVVASLPLLPGFLDSPLEPSPYLPVSRNLWNEFYIDVTRAPGLDGCPEALSMLQASSLQERVRSLRAAGLVDYAAEMRLKREVLEKIARCCFAGGPSLAAVSEFVQAHPLVEDYARFRAAREKHGASWRAWPEPLREHRLTPADYDEPAWQYFIYAQWLAHEQVSQVSSHAREKGVNLYLDLPLGIHADGFDIWREPELFLPDLTAGAPPDPAFVTGQDWSFPPLHPGHIREQGYGYVISYLQHHMAHSQILRIDHVMGLHRLFVIPQGLEPAHGVYLRYPADELYAILTLESQRARTMIVGEDLGTVPPEVRPAMSRHGLQRMHVLHFELVASTGELRAPGRDSVASLNTHDMPPFAAFWSGRDIEEMLRLKLISQEAARTQRIERDGIKALLLKHLEKYGPGRPPDESSALRGCLELLAASQARIVLLNLEDLWQEIEPQNIPGTCNQYPNWRRKARYSFESFREMPEVLHILTLVNNIRKRGCL